MRRMRSRCKCTHSTMAFWRAGSKESGGAADLVLCRNLSENENNVRNGSALQVAALQSRQNSSRASSRCSPRIQDPDYRSSERPAAWPLDTNWISSPRRMQILRRLPKAEYVKRLEENQRCRASEEAVEKARAGVAAAKRRTSGHHCICAPQLPGRCAVPRHNFGTSDKSELHAVDFGKRRATVRQNASPAC